MSSFQWADPYSALLIANISRM